MNIGILAACLPTIKPLFITFFEKARAITAGRTGRSNDRSGYFEQQEPSGHSLDDIAGSKGHHSARIISVYKPRKQHRTHEDSESDDMPLYGQQTQAGARGGAIVKTSEIYIS